MKVLIDADILVYSCGFSAENSVWKVMVGDRELSRFRYKKELDEWMGTGDEIKGYRIVKDKDIQPVANALSNAKQLIKKILLRTNADEYQLYLTGKGNFREEIATTLPYKGNRDSTHKPYHYDSLKRYLIENWGAIIINGMEADDAMSIEQYSNDQGKGDTLIATIDKDLNCCPGKHYNWNKDLLYTLTEWESLVWFYTQLLTGDTVDNIRGVYGIGPVKAKNIYSRCNSEEDLFWAALDQYDKVCSVLNCKPLEDLIENARLLYMLREPLNKDWSNLWEPPY